MASGGLGCETCLPQSTHPKLSVPRNVCQAEVLEFWERENRGSMRVAAEKIWGFRGRADFIDVYKKKEIS